MMCLVLSPEKKLLSASEYKFKCDQCTRKFRRPGELKNHVLVNHFGKNPNQCTFCEKKLNSRKGLYVHLKQVHNVECSLRRGKLFLDKLLTQNYYEKFFFNTLLNVTQGEQLLN
jgi:Zinc finger, C2H2 type.